MISILGEGGGQIPIRPGNGLAALTLCIVESYNKVMTAKKTVVIPFTKKYWHKLD